MKKTALFLSILMCFTLSVQSFASEPLPFSDVQPDAWYYNSVQYAVENQLFTGTSETTFEPEAVMTRAMLVTVLYRVAGEPEIGSFNTGFTDIVFNSWYEKAVIWASNNAIVTGVTDTEFMPDDPISRQEMVSILYRYIETNGGGFTGVWAYKLPYDDANLVELWAYEPMSWFIMNDFISGVGDNKLDPNGSATRAQVATIFTSLAL